MQILDIKLTMRIFKELLNFFIQFKLIFFFFFGIINLIMKEHK
jgi:hypothetical protein